MFVLNKSAVERVGKWSCYCRMKYHSGLGVFGHRPRKANEAGMVIVYVVVAVVLCC